MNELLPSLYELFAQKLAAHPELLAVGRENCRRWLNEGHSAPDRLREWDALLAEAQVAGSAASQKQTLTLASQVQAQIEQSLQQLLLRLEEWNDYQDLIQETRALRDRQLDLRGRTEDLRGTK